MKILAIGNSFSQDATRYLQDIAASAGENLFVRNLYIGGCSLEMHAKNITENAPAYDYEENTRGIEKISIPDALAREEWDYVTVQQVSGLSGKIETYEPYLTEVLNTVKAACPKAKIAFHRTWAYEIDSAHGNFPYYLNNQMNMYHAIVEASSEAAQKHSLPIIGSGDFIQHLRAIPPFDYKNGGASLCRDGFHMSLDYGRYAVGLVWFKFFTGRNAADVTFAPENTDPAYINIIRQEADKFIAK